MGWLTAQDCAPEFAREIFGKPEVGVLPRLVHSRFGLHVVEVLAREPGVEPPFEAVKSAVAQARIAQGEAIQTFDASCFDGVYVTGDISADDISRLNETRLQVEEGDEDNSRLALPNASV